MANHKSAKKRIGSSKRKAQANKRVLKSLRNSEKQLRKDLSEKNTKALEAGLKKVFQLADRAESKGVIKKNTANRKKSRLASQVSKLSS